MDIGGTIGFKIQTPATGWHVDILRLGWYAGDGARTVAAGIQPAVTTAQTQPACLVDTTNTTGLVDCGNWSVSASWSVPSDAVSGVYIAHLVRDDNGGDSLIYFDVRNDASHSDIIYQTSDVTREAYNQYGGNSLYTCTVACPPGNPLLYKSAYEVSFNRPNTAGSLGGMYTFHDAEYPLVQFLEENGYDVSYISGVDTDRSGSLLTNHKTFVSSGHDEYWSGAQRANVTAARDSGVNLAFFSGNEVFWKTRYVNSIDGTATSYRTLVSYKETHFNAPTDPQDPGTWTGTWRDTRFSPPADAQPENSLTGQSYMVDPPSPYAIEVPWNFSDLRFWRNTSVARLASSSPPAVLAPNTLGYEFDEDLDNGYRPAGEIDMSSTTENVQHLVLDYYGNAEGPGTATHHLSLYRAASGALVFGAGTVQWSYGLEPTASSRVDVSMQQATVNLLADMGVQPTAADLMPNLVAAVASTDTTPPTSAITSPVAGTTLAHSSTATVTGTAQDAGGGVVAGVEVSTDGGSTWHPAVIAAATASTTWSYTWHVSGSAEATVESRATDDSANVEKPTSSATVDVTCPCHVFPLSTTPTLADSGDSTAAELGMKFTASVEGYVTGVRFYKASANSGRHVGDLWSSSGTLLASATFTSETGSGWQQVTFANAVHVSAGTVYVVSYHTGTGHEAGDTNAFSGRTVSSAPLTALESSTDTSATTNVSGPNGVYIYGAAPAFPTSTYEDTNYYVDVSFTPSDAAPTVISRSPSPGSTGQLLSAPVTATFSEDVTPSSIAFTLTDPGGSTVPASVSYDSPSHTITLTPSAPLSPGSTYSAMVSGATDSSGRTLAAPVSWTFSTFQCPCSFWNDSTTPQVPDSNDGNGVNLGLTFSSNLSGQISGVRFYKAATNTGTHVGSLWSSSGTLLAQATFQNETASGWQEVTFAPPVDVSAGTPYVVSYFAPAGHYSADSGYFSNGPLSTGPLQAPGGGANGLYGYGAAPGFPSSTYGGANYWVDPVFDTVAAPPAPAISAISSGSPTTSSATITWTTDQPSTSQVDYGPTSSYGTSSQLDSTRSTSHSVTLSGLSSSTPYHFRVDSSDGGGLTQSGDNTFSTLQSPPVISAVSAGTPATTSATITWTTDQPSSSQVDYGGTSKYGRSSVLDPALVTSHSVTLSRLNPLMTFHFRVDSSDGGGVTQSVDKTFTTAGPPPPSIDSTVSASGTDSTSVNVSTPASGDLLLAFVSGDGPVASAQTTAVSASGLTWTLVARANAQRGTADIWSARAPATLARLPVTATLGVAGYPLSLTVVAFHGSLRTGALKVASSASGAPLVSVKTTKADSWVFGAGTDPSTTPMRTLGADQTMVSDVLMSGISLWTQRRGVPTPHPNTVVSIKDTATGNPWNLAVVEVLGAGS